MASKAARCRLAAPNAELIDFAFRRTHGVQAGIGVARASAIAGEVRAARRRFDVDLAWLPAPTRSLDDPVPLDAAITARLAALRDRLHRRPGIRSPFGRVVRRRPGQEIDAALVERRRRGR